MSVERDKTGLRRCKQRGRSQSRCLLRSRRQEKRQAQAGTLKSRRHRARRSGRGYDRVSGSEPAKQAQAGVVLITGGGRVAFGRVYATRGTLTRGAASTPDFPAGSRRLSFDRRK